MIGVAGVVVAVAGRQVPAFAKLASHLDLETLGGRAFGRTVDGVDAPAVHQLRDVVLLGVEHREAGVDPAIQVLGLDPGFVAVALHRVEDLAVDVLAHLRLVDAGVAGVQRVAVVEVVDQPGIGGDHAGLLVALACVGAVGVEVAGVVDALEVADPGAEDHRQVVGGLEAGGQVGAGLALEDVVVADLRDVRLGELAAPVVDAAAHWRVHRAVDRDVLFGVHQHEAGDQLVLAAEQAEGTVQVDVEVVLALVALELAHVHEHAVAAGRVRVAAAGRAQQGVVLAAQVVVADLQGPVTGQLLFQGGEQGLVLEVAAAPVGGRIERAGEVGPRAVAEVHREAGPGGAPGAGVLLVQAEGQQSVGGQVGLQHAVGDVLGVLVVVEVGAAVLVDPDKAPAQVAGFGQRAGNVPFAAVVVPGTDGAGDRSLELFGRPLADQVDGGRRVTGAGHQAGGALDDLHPVEGRHVGAGGAVVVDPVVGGVDPVVLEVGDGHAAAGELPALAVVVLHADPGGPAQGVGDAGGALVVHLLAGDHRHRLRGFAQRQVEAGGRGAGPGGVALAAFGDAAQALGGNLRGAQLQRAAGGGKYLEHIAAADRLGLQPGVRQQQLQGLCDAVAAVQAGALLAGGQVVVPGNEHRALLGEAVEHRDQRPGADAVAAPFSLGLVLARIGSSVGPGRGAAQQCGAQGQGMKGQARTTG